MKTSHRFIPILISSILTGNYMESSAQACAGNLDFEYGNFTNWTGSVGYNHGTSCGYLHYTSLGIIYGTLNQPVSACQYHTLINAAYPPDPYGGFPGVSPNGGSYSVRLGGDHINLY